MQAAILAELLNKEEEEMTMGISKEELKEGVIDYPEKDWITKQSALDLIDQLDEAEKVAVPQFVAEWIEYEQKEGLFNPMRSLIRDRGFPGDYKLRDWFFKDKANEGTFMRAWLDGYTVEEKKYHVLDKKGCVLLKKYINGASLIMTTGIKPERFPEWQQGDLMLTEKEIKDYDERYWPFAEEVTE